MLPHPLDTAAVVVYAWSLTAHGRGDGEVTDSMHPFDLLEGRNPFVPVAGQPGRAIPLRETMSHRMMLIEQTQIQEGLEAATELCHRVAVESGWWHDTKDGTPLDRNKGELLCLIHSEISEAMEGERKGLMDDKLPHRPMAEVELADALIRIFDYAGGFGYDLAGALLEKLEYNATREDHRPDRRIQEGGKRF